MTYPICPGVMVRVKGPDQVNITLWRTLGGDGITGRLRPRGCALVLARYIRSPEPSLGDQLLVLTDQCQLGWNETQYFTLA